MGGDSLVSAKYYLEEDSQLMTKNNDCLATLIPSVTLKTANDNNLLTFNQLIT